MKKKELKLLLETEVPILLWSSPGEGKTSIIEEIGREMNAEVETIIASIRQPQDFLGYPYREDNKLKFSPPDWAVRISDNLKKGKNAILFLDEITTCSPVVQASLLRVINEKKSGDIDLSGVMIISAANTRSQSNGYKLSMATMNRFCHIKWNIDIDEWKEYMTCENVKKEIVKISKPNKKFIREITAMYVEAYDNCKDYLSSILPPREEIYNIASKRSIEKMAIIHSYILENEGIYTNKEIAVEERHNDLIKKAFDGMVGEQNYKILDIVKLMIKKRFKYLSKESAIKHIEYVIKELDKGRKIDELEVRKTTVSCGVIKSLCEERDPENYVTLLWVANIMSKYRDLNMYVSIFVKEYISYVDTVFSLNGKNYVSSIGVSVVDFCKRLNISIEDIIGPEKLGWEKV